MKEKFANKKVAIILGFFNGNAYIDLQIKSILEQNFKNIDVFIFDDHSPTQPPSNQIVGIGRTVPKQGLLTGTP